jgi:PAS domain S-box-containing protein
MNLLANLVEQFPAPIIHLDGDGKVQIWNLAAEQVFGWKDADVLAQPLPFIPVEHIHAFTRLLREILAEGGQTMYATPILTCAGNLRPEQTLCLTAIRNAAGEVDGAAVSISSEHENVAHLRMHIRLIEVINRIQQSILVSQSVQDICRTALQQIPDLIPIDSGQIFLYEENGRTARILAVEDDCNFQTGWQKITAEQLPGLADLEVWPNLAGERCCERFLQPPSQQIDEP